MLLNRLTRHFTTRSARDYVPQIDKLVPFNTKGFVMQKKTKEVHPDTLAKQKQVKLSVSTPIQSLKTASQIKNATYVQI